LIALDTAALTEPVRPQRVRAHAKQLKKNRPLTLGSTIGSGLLGCVILAAIVLFGVLLTDLTRLPAGVPIALAAFALVLAAVAFLWWKVGQRLRADRVGRYRLQNFAAANDMTYHDEVADPGHPGMIFAIGGERISTNVLRTSSAPLIEFGHHQYIVHTGDHAMTHHWGYVAITLDVTLPHIVLDAVGNNSILGSSLPTSFGSAQRLSLEGDFDRYFELYCPEGYERDALYLFSPDVMARFVDTGALFDIEIVDNTLFLYTGPAVVTLSPSMWEWLFDTVTALNAKLARWERWRDERKPEPPQQALQGTAPSSPALQPGVAIAGQRLRTRRRGVWIVIGAVVFGLVGYILQTV
jgi:hypothetical protein